MRRYVLVCFVFAFTASFGQKQLVLMKGERVLHRFLPGDVVYLKVKNDPVRYHSYINNILDDAVVIEQDTIPYAAIERTYTGQRKFLSGLGKTLVQVGVGIFLIDQFNTVVVQKGKASLDGGIPIFSAICVGVGLPLMLVKKDGEPVGVKYKLRPIDNKSPFYRER